MQPGAFFFHSDMKARTGKVQYHYGAPKIAVLVVAMLPVLWAEAYRTSSY